MRSDWRFSVVDPQGLSPIEQTVKSLVLKSDEGIRAYYEAHVYPLQDLVLSKTPKLPGLVLSGGTALSRFIYRHRYSDDLDFYFYGQDTPENMSSFQTNLDQFRNKLSAAGLSVKVAENSEYFNQWFVSHSGDENPLKVEFIYELRKSLGQSVDMGDFARDSLENLAVNKVGTTLGRSLVRDTIDLMVMSKDISFGTAMDYSVKIHGAFDKEDLYLIAKNVISPRDIKVYMTEEPDIAGILNFMTHVTTEAHKRIEREGEVLKKKLPGVLSDLFWDDSSPGRAHTKIESVDLVTPEQASRILEYGSSVLFAALGPKTLRHMQSLIPWSLRLSNQKRLVLRTLSES